MQSNSGTMLYEFELSNNVTLLAVEYIDCIFAERKDPPHLNKCPRYHIKPSDGKVPVLELWGMCSVTFSVLAKVSRAAELCLMLPKYCETFNSLLYMKRYNLRGQVKGSESEVYI